MTSPMQGAFDRSLEAGNDTRATVRKIFESISDAVAGRQFRHAAEQGLGDQRFLGVPDAPDALMPEEDEHEHEAGAEGEGQAPPGAQRSSAGGIKGNTSGSLAWGGHANGQIPSDAMADIGGGHRLEASAAKAFEAMRADAAKAGVNISITDSYRSYSQQVSVRKRKGHLVATATPGTSNHGWGRALDINVNDGRTLAWLRANGHRYGWVNPPWAQQRGKSYEPWHWEFRSGGQASSGGGGHAHSHQPRPTPIPDDAFDIPSPQRGTGTVRIQRDSSGRVVGL